MNKHDRLLQRSRRQRELNQLRLQRSRERQAHRALRWERDERFNGVTQLGTGEFKNMTGPNWAGLYEG